MRQLTQGFGSRDKRLEGSSNGRKYAVDICGDNHVLDSENVCDLGGLEGNERRTE